MTESNDIPTHPSVYVKQNVIPNGMSVTKAAKLLGIGRSALSNFLNGKSSLSPEMARRLERVFGADRELLLDLQSRFDGHLEKTQLSIVTGTNSPMLGSIWAAEIDNWANRERARSALPALIRKLIHTTGSQLSRVEFPAYDNVQRIGWDGELETNVETPWMPYGKSGWEVSCNKDPRSKAEKDYSARIKSVSTEERRDTSFVFVTARNWSTKKKWEAEKVEQGEWKDVRAYDASDLEQWIEQSAPTQVWMSEQIGRPISGYRTLNQCWSEWAESCEPVLDPKLFEQHVQEHSKKFDIWMNDTPSRPLVIDSDSRGEGLAFLYCLFNNPGYEGRNDGVVVFDSPEAVQRFIASNSVPRIAVVHTPDVEKDIGGLFRDCHCVIIRASRDVNNKPDIRLGLVGGSKFKSTLLSMGLSEHEAKQLTRKSARSPTILRRCLSLIPAVKKPPWAESSDTARILLPTALVGAWCNTNSADREIIKLLANLNDENILYDGFAELLNIEDAPIWSEGDYYGVVSRTDALFGVAKFVREQDLDNFFFVAELVLSERDPAIDLPIHQQWMANVYGKHRDHSDALRRGIRETLILLAVFGTDLFQGRQCVNIEHKVADLVETLLTPLNYETLMSQKSDLSDYAEAAPKFFLSLIEEDLRQDTPVSQQLMKPATYHFPESPNRTNLLWAMESLAWNPRFFPRVVEVLAKLSELELREESDNWSNKSENSLHSLFRSWYPMTTANLDERTSVFEQLCHRHPKLGWKLCLMQLDRFNISTSDNYRPRWRDDAENADFNPKYDEHNAFIRKTVEIVFGWPSQNKSTLADLVRCIEIYTEDELTKLWSLIDQWVDSQESHDVMTLEDDKAYLHEKIQKSIELSKRKGRSISNKKHVKELLDKLQPTDVIIQNLWLFKSYWIDFPNENVGGKNFTYESHIRKVENLRIKAIQKIWNTHGFGGIVKLLNRINQTEDIVGEVMAKTIIEEDKIASFVCSCLQASKTSDTDRYKACLTGLLRTIDSSCFASLVNQYKQQPEILLTLLLSLPYCEETWRFLDEMDRSFRDSYWKRVEARLWFDDSSVYEINQSIDQLLAAGRVVDAFKSSHMIWEKVETIRIKKLLNTLQSTKQDKINDFVSATIISAVFDELDRRTDISVDEKALLEFTYFRALQYSEHGLPNLERRVVESPELFVHAIRCFFGRSDGTDDSSELGFVDKEHHKRVAEIWFAFFLNMKQVPGTDSNGKIDFKDLENWVRRSRELLKQHDRVKIGDEQIGAMLARAPKGDEGFGPCDEVCQILESVASEHIGIGFSTGTQNLGGVEFVEELSRKEKELAARYRRLAREKAHRYPFVGSVLNRIADSYESSANWWETESKVQNRLMNI